MSSCFHFKNLLSISSFSCLDFELKLFVCYNLDWTDNSVKLLKVNLEFDIMSQCHRSCRYASQFLNWLISYSQMRLCWWKKLIICVLYNFWLFTITKSLLQLKWCYRKKYLAVSLESKDHVTWLRCRDIGMLVEMFSQGEELRFSEHLETIEP